jgi:hypothetical protein
VGESGVHGNRFFDKERFPGSSAISGDLRIQVGSDRSDDGIHTPISNQIPPIAMIADSPLPGLRGTGHGTSRNDRKLKPVHFTAKKMPGIP